MELINGYPIIAAWYTAARGVVRAGQIILVDRGAEHEERWVVAWQGRGEHGWDSSWGDACYCQTFSAARAVFIGRIEREDLPVAP